MCSCGSKVASSLRLRGPPPPVAMVLLMACTITACSRVGCRKEMRKAGGARVGQGGEERGGRKEEVKDSVGNMCVGTSPSSALLPSLICKVNAIMHCSWIYFWFILCTYTQ